MATTSSASPISNLSVYDEAVGRARVWECSSDSVLASVALLLPLSVLLSECVMCHLHGTFPNK